MKRLRNNFIRAGLGALYLSGVHHALRPLLAGVGTIFTLHHVRPARDDPFQPNRHLEVTPQFLRAMLKHLRTRDVDIVDLDEAATRLRERNFSRRFACITLDDGYRDNRDFALPVLAEFDAPMTVFVTTDFADGTGRLWWIALERALARAKRIDIEIGGVQVAMDTATPEAKDDAFDRVSDTLRACTDEAELRRVVSEFCARHGVDELAIARELCLTWPELQAFADHPSTRIGAHSVTHCNLAYQSETVAAHEIAASRARLEQALQTPVLHFAYPYGDRPAAGSREFALAEAAGFKTALTTRPGMIFADNAEHPFALPRLSLNGHYQDERLLPVLTSGAPTAMWNGFRRVAAA